MGEAIANHLSIPFIDGDDLHPKASVEKMASGQPLTDEDRVPWLEIIRTKAEHMAVEGSLSESTGAGVVIACSALKKSYREILRGKMKSKRYVSEHSEPSRPDALLTYFVFLKGERNTLMERMKKRNGHFMKVTMLDSQLQTLESPEDEGDVVVISIEDTIEDQLKLAREGLGKLVGDTT